MNATDMPSVSQERGVRRILARMPLRLEIAIAIIVILVESAIYFSLIRHQAGAFSDLLGREQNFRDLATTGNIYTNYAVEGFTYPPAGILLLSPIVLIPLRFVGLAWTIGVLTTLLLTFFLVLRSVMKMNESAALLGACALTIVSPVLWSSVYDVIFWGQLGTVLTLLIVADYLVIRGSLRGVLVGLASALKIYPAIFIVIWLCKRQYREAITAMVTVLITTGAAFLFWYQSSVTFLRHQLLGNQELAHFAGMSTARGSSSVDDIFLRTPFFFGRLPAHQAVVVGGLVVLVGLFAAVRAWSRGHFLTSVVLGLIISVIGSPIAWNHYFSFLPLMLFLPRELGWRSGITRAAYFALAVNVVPWHRWRFINPEQFIVPKGTLYLSYLAQNATLFSMLILVAVAAFTYRPQPTVNRERASRRSPFAATSDGA